MVTFKLFQNLELSKRTDDIVDQMQYINLKDKLKYYLFYLIPLLIGIGIYISVMHKISNDKFRAELIKQGKPPIATLFYSTYQKELKKINKSLSEAQKQESKLQFAKAPQLQHIKSFNEWLQNIDKAEKIETVKQATAHDRLLISYLHFFIKNNEDIINLNNKPYTYFQVSYKLNNLPSDIAEKAINDPINQIKAKVGADTAEKIKVLKEALYKLYQVNRNYRDKRFYYYVNIDNISDDDYVRAFAAQKLKVKAKSNYIYITFDLPKKYQKEYQKYRSEAQAKIAKAKKEYQKNKEKTKELIEANQQKISLLNEARQAIIQLQNNPANYDQNKKIVENTLSKIKE